MHPKPVDMPVDTEEIYIVPNAQNSLKVTRLNGLRISVERDKFDDLFLRWIPMNTAWDKMSESERESSTKQS